MRSPRGPSRSLGAVSDIVGYDVDGSIAVITLNRPEARNAVNGDVAEGLEAAIDRLEDTDGVWAGVLTANTADPDRPVFCAGADLKVVNSGNGARMATRKGGFAGFVYRDRRKPVIAAVDGLATAGGCEIVLACDLVVASTRASFGLAEVTRSLVAAAGGLFRLPRAVGRNVAMEAILTGEPLSAHRAYQLGMVNRLVEPDETLAAAKELAARIARSAPLAVWESRRVVLAAESNDDDTLRSMSDQAMAVVVNSDDLAEGLTAFIEKRPPVWRGR